MIDYALDTVEFFVVGVPQTAGSKVSGVAHRRTPDGTYEPVRKADGRLKTFTKDDTGAAGKTWRADVRAAAEDAMDGRRPLDGPLRATIIFRMPRPKGHFGSRGLKASAPRWHVVRPDVDKLSRAMLDALTGIAWGDDSQVVFKTVMKPYAEPGDRIGADVQIAPLLESEEQQMELR